MARDSDPNSVHILAHYMLTDADAGVQHAAETALTELATDQARFVLVEMLGTGTLEPSKTARVLRALATFDGPVVRETLGRFLESPSDAVVDQAALGLARQNEGVAVPYLVALLRRPEEPLRPRAVEALQDLTCVTLVVTGYDAVADQVEAWYRVHKDGGDRAWFRDALEKKGYDGGALLGYVVKGELDPRAVPVLLRALRDDDPTLRRGAAIALQRSTGRGYGAVGRGTPKDQVVRVADRWSQWWATSPSNPASGRR
jgi:HEAT repeat protein